MKNLIGLFGILAIAVSNLVLCETASAQATRTWVSGVGDDANPCSRTAPCKTFAGAISKTAAGGAINTLDPAGYGAVTITKSISIISDIANGGVLNSLTTGVIVNAGPTDVVALHGLVIDGGGGNGGGAGIRFLAGQSLNVTNCIIRNQLGVAGSTTQAGEAISMERASGFSTLFVSDTDISRGASGIAIKTTGTGQIRASLDRLKIKGLTGAGVTSDGAGSLVYLGGSVITANTPGLSAPNGGRIWSYGDNALLGNNGGGSPTATVSLQ